MVGALLLPVATHHAAAAHVATIGYSHIDVDGQIVTWNLYLDPFHLDTFLLMDEDHDGEIGAPEVRAQAEAIRQMVAPHLESMNVETGERPSAEAGEITLITMSDTGLSGEGFTTLTDFPLVAVPVTFTFDELVPEYLLLTYGLFLESGFGDHNNTARIDAAGTSSTFVFELEEPAILLGDLPAVADDAATSSGSRTWMLVTSLTLFAAAVAGLFGVLLVRSRSHPAATSPATSPPSTTRARPRGAIR